ncbi:MAG: PAS domain-containing sensor histidine kinase [Candidatus Paracaedibacteraceae bacterium]|nr:PAS domain-containing sensor histidine kinase [Candidatus Paracaedibacteraceae bacterium]
MASLANKTASYEAQDTQSAYKESILKKLSKKLNGGVISLDKQGIITAVSNEFLELVDQPESLILGKTLANFIGQTKLEDYFLKQVDFMLAGKVPALNFSCFWETDTKKLNLFFEFYPPEGNDTSIGGFIQKLTEAHLSALSQADVEQIMQHLGAVIWTSGADPRDVYYVSPSFKSFYEMNLDDHIKDPSIFLSRIHSDDLDIVIKLFAPTPNNDLVRQGDFRYRLNNGSWQHITFYRSPFYDGNAKLLKFISIAIDSTPLYKVQEKMQLQQLELSRINGQLEKTNTMLEEFTSFACHDLSAPLRAFKIYTELLENAYLKDVDEEGNLMLLSIKTAIERMQDLIKGIGRLSIIGVEELPLPSAYISITDLIKRTIVPLYAPPFSPLCKIEVNDLHPLRIKEEHLIAILENLLTNSIKYTNNFPHIKIRSKEFKAAIVYTFSDNGIGIPAEADDFIFKFGKRLQAKPEQSGSGIGLFACKKIMSLYGGKIWVHSTVGKGSTFYLLFPKHDC